nr:hypothetical protein [Tanacetum cinerariifolium]
DTLVPQPSGPIEIVIDESIYKERGDRLVRVATTSSSLEAEVGLTAKVESSNDEEDLEPIQESSKEEKVANDKETTDLKQLIKVILCEEEVAIDAIPFAVKSPTIVDGNINKEGKKSYYYIICADGSSEMYLLFSKLLKSFDREDLVELYKLVKDRYGSSRLVEDLDLLL